MRLKQRHTCSVTADVWIGVMMILVLIAVPMAGAQNTQAEKQTKDMEAVRKEAEKVFHLSSQKKAMPSPNPQTASSVDEKKETATVPTGVPVAIIPQKSYMFPKTVEGKIVTHDFIVQNKGTAPLEIKKVRTG